MFGGMMFPPRVLLCSTRWDSLLLPYLTFHAASNNLGRSQLAESAPLGAPILDRFANFPWDLQGVRFPGSVLEGRNAGLFSPQSACRRRNPDHGRPETSESSPAAPTVPNPAN